MATPRLPLAAVASLLGIVAGVGCSGASRPAAESAPWLESPWPAADRLFQRDRFWVGGDGAYSIDLGHDRVLWLFGDSWIDTAGSARRTGATMVSNTVAIQRGYDPSSASAEFFWGTTTNGEAGAFFADFPGGRYWPGDGVLIDGRLLLFLMKVRSAEGGLGFDVSAWTAVMIDNPAAAPPEWNVRWLDTPRNERRIIVGSGAVLRHGRHVYAFGAREPGPGHDVFLARWPVPAASQGRLEPMEWWAGRERGWAADPAGAVAQPVFTEAQTEFTVHFDEVAGAFVEFQTAGFGPASVVRRTAADLTGPWSAPDTVFTPPQASFPRILIYQGKAHPHLTGADLVATYSTNSLDFGDHLTERWLYFPRFLRLTRHDAGRLAPYAFGRRNHDR